MKKLIILIIFISLLCCGCNSNRKAITMDEFRSKTVEKDYNFFDVTDNFLDNTNIKEASMAATNIWHIEFYILDTDLHAEEMFEFNKKSFLEIKDNSKSYSEDINKKNIYSLTTIKEYMYVSRIDNTLIFARVPVENRGAVKRFIKDLGY